MIIKFFSKLFSNRNDRILEQIQKTIERINSLESKFSKLSDTELRNKTDFFRYCLKSGYTLNSLLSESFSVVREASKRVFGMRHFDVQLLGGIILHHRCVAEMRTGEGKTLTATLPAYLNALEGKGVHIVTMNDYLAKRDADNNKILFNFLGLTVGVNISGMSPELKRKAYSSDITYGTNNEYSFDYLRDNMVFDKKDRVQRSLNFALIDEVDSILIDEARTPLIISKDLEDSSGLYFRINKIIPKLISQKKEDSDISFGIGHFLIDEKQRQVSLTEKGLVEIEQWLLKENLIKSAESLYSSKNIVLMHHVIAALRAHNLFFKNVDYIVQNKNVVIVDEHTGRTMEGKRWSDGLHQAIEAKEKVEIKSESETLASITFQNYFRLYNKLSGMTGTAITEASELRSIYNLDTIVIPTNRPMIRNDMPDLIYMTELEKIDAIIKDIQTCIKRNQPVLVGTVSIKKSELISKRLVQLGIKHNVLNANFHSQEADIIAQAGKLKAVTIATNMAGRGTDIVLGGSLVLNFIKRKTFNEKKIQDIKDKWKKEHDLVLKSGGLHIIGTERHESRRIDNQLRGRSGRQGDVGSSRFYLSMEDSLMRIFSSDRIISIMKALGVKHGEAITHSFITKAIANAQKKVENQNFDIRKQLLEYDDIANEQRCIIYYQRNRIIDSENINDVIKKISYDIFVDVINKYIKKDSLKETWKTSKLELCLYNDFNLVCPIVQWLHDDNTLYEEELTKRILKFANISYKRKRDLVGIKNMNQLEKSIMIETLDMFWKEHLSAMECLRQGIHLRSYAQKDPKQEYKRESFIMFSSMLKLLKKEVVSILFKINFFNTNHHA
ncbi:MAG: preprotein translocase subunit SecA [Buchnera aphidicola (Kaburagia rhusicola rhusicola)]